MNNNAASGQPVPPPTPVILPTHSRAGGLLWSLRLLIFAVLVCSSPFLFQSPVGQRGMLAAVLLGLVGMLLVFSPRTGLPALLIFLSVLGGVRRWLIPLLGWTPTDPLVLVGPLIAAFYFLNLLATRVLPTDTRVARLLLWLLGLMTLEIVNPLQGGISVGFAGALFYIVPVLWYYLGRRLGSPFLLQRLFKATIGIAIAAALYGLYQTWFGFLPSELDWIRLSGMGALSVNGTIRALSFFTSPQEYVVFVGIAIVLLWALWLRGSRLALVPIPLLVLAIFLESGRGSIISTLAACTAVWAVQGKNLRTWVPRGLIAVAIAVAGLVLSLHQIQTVAFSTQTQNLVDHQTQGLLDPTNSKTSTAGIHSSMVGNGILQGFKSPAGLGLGATTIAAAKFAGSGANTELDLSNMFASLGFIGGLLYTAIIGLTLFKGFHFWHLARTRAALGILAVLLICLGQWVNGQLYAAVLLVWVCIGALDRMQADWTRPVPQRKTPAELSLPAKADA